MISAGNSPDPSRTPGQIELTFRRFTLAQRWEHTVLLVSFTVLLLTGLPQKYQHAEWSQWIISSPERLRSLQQVHHIFALLLIAGALYHLANAIILMARRKLPGIIFPTWKDIQDAWSMLKYLLFLSPEKPKFGKYNFEQKFTYWFLFFGILILIVSGLILWFPTQITWFLPGGIIPAAFLAHSNEAITAAIFIIIWHFYHVHVERLNLSIFTGKMNATEMQKYHALEYEQLTSQETDPAENQGERK